MRRVTSAQSQWLRRIAHSPLMVTYTDDGTRYSLQSGATVSRTIAEVLIRNGWVRPERDGLFDQPQTYRVLAPAK